MLRILFTKTLQRNFSKCIHKIPSNIVTLSEARRFVFECFLKSKTSPENSEAMSHLLIAADYRGYQNGMSRLEMYVNDLHKNSTDGYIQPRILNETPATAWVDGQNGLGVVVGKYCMDLAIKKAKAVGVGWVCAKRSNHYGMASWYTMQAIVKGYIGISMSNGLPLVQHTGSKTPVLGTNPLSFAAPANSCDSFVLDMPTSTIKPLNWAQHRIEKQPIYSKPAGGSKTISDHKEDGLGTMVEVLCAVLSGSNLSSEVPPSTSKCDVEANLGQLFIVINPNCFNLGFNSRLSELNKMLRCLLPMDPKSPVMVAGDAEIFHMEKVNAAGGIEYSDIQVKICNELAKRLCVDPLKFTSYKQKPFSDK